MRNLSLRAALAERWIRRCSIAKVRAAQVADPAGQQAAYRRGYWDGIADLASASEITVDGVSGMRKNETEN